ncbi:hypothetical protein HY224_02075 [Candidatus Uhrbacteria bacterium]|nr:hypothetical protein [Candidatus Uhrbacteria bacterium]
MPVKTNLIRRQSFSKKSTSPRWPTTFEDEKIGHRGLKLLFLGFVLAVWLYLVFFSSSFKVKSVEITGANWIINAQLHQSVKDYLNEKKWFFLSYNNIYLFNFKSANELAGQLGLENIKWSKNLLDNSVFITYTEKQPLVILGLNNQAYYLDKNGEIIKIAPLNNLVAGLPIVFIQNEEQKKLINGDLVKNLRKISDKGQAVGLKIVAINFQLTPDVVFKGPGKDKVDMPAGNLLELAAITESNWTIHFGEKVFINPETVDRQLFNLEAITKAKLGKLKPDNLSYIDLRFGDKVFYK